jgi:hypothetical protein
VGWVVGKGSVGSVQGDYQLLSPHQPMERRKEMDEGRLGVLLAQPRSSLEPYSEVAVGYLRDLGATLEQREPWCAAPCQDGKGK